MKLRRFFPSMLLLGMILLSGPDASNAQTPARPGAYPVAVEDLLYARPFALASGYRFSGNQEEPATIKGLIVVLRVDPSLVVPTESPEPILYAGDQPVQRLNWGHPSGHVIGIIPGAFDLATQPVWFGEPEISSRSTPERKNAERARANARMKAFGAEKVKQSTRAPVESEDFAALLRGEIAELVLEYAPQESELARKWRLPEAIAKPNPARPAEQAAGGTVR